MTIQIVFAALIHDLRYRKVRIPFEQVIFHSKTRDKPRIAIYQVMFVLLCPGLNIYFSESGIRIPVLCVMFGVGFC